MKIIIMKLPVIIQFIKSWRAQTSRLQILYFLSFPKHTGIGTCPNLSCLGGVGGVSRRILLQCFGNLRKSSSKEETDAASKWKQWSYLLLSFKVLTIPNNLFTNASVINFFLHPIISGLTQAPLVDWDPSPLVLPLQHCAWMLREPVRWLKAKWRIIHIIHHSNDSERTPPRSRSVSQGSSTCSYDRII